MKTINELHFAPGKKILFVFPHPDDEQAFATGLYLQSKKAGLQTKSICLTNGEKSTLRYGLGTDDDLGKVRATEYKNALNILDIKDYDQPNFGDGKLREQTNDLYQYILNEINNTQFDYVSTFEPDGVYGHPDHIEISKVITQIYHDNKNFRLIYATVDNSFDPDQGSKNMADDYSQINPIKANMILTLRISDMIKKAKALACHKSQTAQNMNIKNFPSMLKFLRHEHHFVV